MILAPLRVLYIPMSSGDFRLERSPVGPDRCVLTVEDPTLGDYLKLDPFLVEARGRAWIRPSSGIAPTGRSVIEIGASIAAAGRLLAEAALGDSEKWTAVRYVNGQITVDDGVVIPEQKNLSPEDVTPQDEPGAQPKVAADAADAAATKKPKKPKTKEVEATYTDPPKPKEPAPEPVAAAVVRQPRVGCPEPTACERRASEVLRTFCTARQWNQFEREGRIKVIGNATGKAYHVYHKNRAASRGLGRSVTEAGDPSKILCVWQENVPPEEEMLTLKLALEHREGWLLAIGAKTGHGGFSVESRERWEPRTIGLR